MPRGDRTGPEGYGPMTERARGLCAGYPSPGYMDGAPAFRGRGGGQRGNRNRYYASGLTGWQRANPGYPVYGGMYPPAPEFTKDQEIEALSGHIDSMQRELDANKKRLEELNKETGD